MGCFAYRPINGTAKNRVDTIFPDSCIVYIKDLRQAAISAGDKWDALLTVP
jgi:hypothetical protein